MPSGSTRRLVYTEKFTQTRLHRFVYTDSSTQIEYTEKSLRKLEAGQAFQDQELCQHWLVMPADAVPGPRLKRAGIKMVANYLTKEVATGALDALNKILASRAALYIAAILHLLLVLL